MTPNRFWTVLDIAACAITLVPLGLALATLSGSGHRWIDLAAQFTAPALVAAAVWALLLLLLRLKASSVLGVLATLLLVIAVWPQWFPHRDAVDPTSETLTVYSANLWARNTDTALMAASIAEADPDVVLLVELGDVPAEDLDTLLPDHPYRLVSIVSNRKVAPARALVASRRPLKRIQENPHDRVVALSARTQTALGPVAFTAAHLTRPWPYRDQTAQMDQVEDLAVERARLGQTAIIAGDFNSVSSARIGRLVKSETALRPVPAFPGTWPTKLPALLGITIDQVWYSPDLVVTGRELGLENGSDHRPVITRFRRAQSRE